MASATDMGCCDPHRLGMAGAGVVPHGGGRHRLDVAILTDLEWPVLVAWDDGLAPDDITLRSSPTWNGRCWRAARPARQRRRGSCDPHRLGMAGAGHEAPEGDVVQAGVAILTDLEWPVLACRSAGPCRAPRSCDPHRLGMAGAGSETPRRRNAREGVAILTDLEWPVLDDRYAVEDVPPGCCDPHRLGIAGAGGVVQHGCPGGSDVAILTDLEWPVLGAGALSIARDPQLLRSSPTWNGRCWPRPHQLDARRDHGCDPHRLGMAGAGPGRSAAPTGATSVAILTDLEWPVLVRLTVNPGVLHVQVAILTDLEWPVLVRSCVTPLHEAHELRSSPTWNGRCWC